MADYIEGEYIANFPKIESMSDDDLLIVEDNEATKQATFAQLKEGIESVKNITPYFGIAGSPDFYPSHDGSTASVLGSGTLGTMVLGDSGTWETDIPEMEDYDYLWVSLYVEYLDGTSEWLTPIRLTDENAKNDIKALIEEVTVAQLAIENNEQKIQDYADQINEINKSLEESGTAISDLEDRLTAAESGIDTNKSSITALETRVDNTESDISDIKKDIEDINSNIIDIKEDIESLMKLIGDTNISDMGDGTITGAIDSVRYAHVAPDEEGDN